MQKKVLVTGGAGFIGANLVRILLQHDYAVTVLDNLSVVSSKYIDRLPIRFVKGDILDVELLNKVVPGHEMVVHLAAQTGVPGSLANPRYDCEINVIGTLNMLEASRNANVKRFIFASSNAPLGKQPPPATEDKAPLPISPYGASKLAGEGYCLAYHGSWGLGTVVLRFANLYGPYSTHKSSVVAKFLRDIVKSGEIRIDGDGQQTRDFIYVDDLCTAIVLALESDVGGEVFQIATGQETSIEKLASLVQEVTRSEFKIKYGDSRLGDIRKNYSGIGKAKQILGWQPRTKLIIGLNQTWESFFPSKPGKN